LLSSSRTRKTPSAGRFSTGTLARKLKSSVTMRNLKIKKFISTVLALSLLLCTWVSAYADSDVPQPDVAQIENADLFVTEEVAEQLALLFIRDMSESGVAAWDETTEPTRMVPMYDETGENITAYTVELTAGYVVVSAYVDVPNLFFEWADEAEPVYADLVESPAGLRKARGSAPSTEKVVHVGPLGYYLDNGTDTLLGEEGEEVPREALSNDFDEFRDIENVTPEAIEMIVESKEEAAENGGISPLAADNTSGGYITDSAAYAKNLYGGTWKCTSWSNKWESAANFAVTSSFSGYRNHCGLVAITNAIKMYGNQYNNNYIKGLSNHDVFRKVVEVNQLADQKYYVVTLNANGEYEGGTFDSTANEFIVKSFKKCGVSVSTYGENPYLCTIQNMKNATSADRLMYVMLHKYGDPYVDHHLIGYAWACLTDYTYSYPRNLYFLKICDGHKPSARALDMSRLVTDTYWEIKF
jgi:hypothetical protein